MPSWVIHDKWAFKLFKISKEISRYVNGIRLTGVTTCAFLDILNYKSYHKGRVTIRYVDVVKAMRNGKAIVIGFVPLLLRYLREKDIQYLIIDKIEDEH
jgi:hypothetical protein